MAGPLRGGRARAWPTRKITFFEALTKKSAIFFVATKLEGEGGKALVAVPLKKYLFCGFPYVHTVCSRSVDPFYIVTSYIRCFV